MKEDLKTVIEALLMVSDEPLSVTKIYTVLSKQDAQISRSMIKTVIDALRADYRDRGIVLKEVASGFRFQVPQAYTKWAQGLLSERPPRYSRALLETLAIIAYRQPITRSQIEEIRGVSVSSAIIKTLEERGWVHIVGHRNVPGKPALLATTKVFLDYFNLSSLDALPPLEDLQDIEQINADLFTKEPTEPTIAPGVIEGGKDDPI